MTAKHWLRDKYQDKAELFEAFLRLFENQVTDDMVRKEFPECVVCNCDAHLDCEVGEKQRHLGTCALYEGN